MRYVPLFLFFLLPHFSHAAIIFSEIAWMGTSVNANDEWIELYNHDAASVNVVGWSISDGVSLDITLTGTIPGSTIVLLERTDDDTVPGVTAFQIYTGALANDGRTLTLKRADGTTEDRVVGGENWASIGGDNVTKKTPQGTMMGWVTGTPTPGAENVAHDDTDTDEESDDDTNGEVKGIAIAQKNDGSGVRISLTESPNELNLSFSSADIVYVNEQVKFEGNVSGIGDTIMDSLVYRWNFGDTYTGEGKSVTHTFAYPGKYVVVLNASYARHDVTVRKVVEVLPVNITLSRTLRGDTVLTNNANHDIDLSGYVVRGTESFVLPKDTYLLKGGSLTIPKSRVLSNSLAMVALYDTEKTMVGSEMSASAHSVSFARATPQNSPLASYVAPRAQQARRTPEPAVAFPSDSTLESEIGEVAGTTTVFENLTIPVYAPEEESSQSTKSPSNILPYAGLIALIIVAIVLLYRRPA